MNTTVGQQSAINKCTRLYIKLVINLNFFNEFYIFKKFVFEPTFDSIDFNFSY